MPELTLSKVPLGGVDWPYSFHPQHSTLPVLFTPQLWEPPALTPLKLPLGEVDWP